MQAYHDHHRSRSLRSVLLTLALMAGLLAQGLLPAVAAPPASPRPAEAALAARASGEAGGLLYRTRLRVATPAQW